MDVEPFEKPCIIMYCGLDVYLFVACAVQFRFVLSTERNRPRIRWRALREAAFVCHSFAHYVIVAAILIMS